MPRINKAAAICIFDEDNGTFLSVENRKVGLLQDNPCTTIRVFPGGKCEYKETFRRAAWRELIEETGYCSNSPDFQEVLDLPSFDADGNIYWTRIFFTSARNLFLPVPEIVPEYGCNPAWVSRDVLLSGPFGECYVEVFDKLGI